MSTTYNGSGTTIHTSAPLLDDSDRPHAALWRVPFEKIFDSLAALDGGVSSLAIRTTGGTYTLTNDLVIDGDEWRFAAIARILSGGSLAISSGGFINVVSGGTIDLDGTLDIGGDSFVRSGVTFTIRAGADLEVEDGATIALAGDMVLSGAGDIIVGSNALITVQAGGAIGVDGTLAVNATTGRVEVAATGVVEFQRGRDLTIDGETFTLDVLLTPTGCGYDTGAPIWRRDNDGTTTNWAWVQKLATVGAQNFVEFAVPARPGDVIDNFVVRIEGGFGAGHTNVPATVPIARLVSIDNAGVATVIASQADVSPNVAGYDAAHNISSSIGLAHTVDGSSSVHLFVQIFGESGTDSVANTTAVHRVIVNGTRNSVLGSGSREYR